jgi:hypothetical protein
MSSSAPMPLPPPLPAQVLQYATPIAGAPAMIAPMAFRDGKILVVPDRLQISDTCIKCNAPADGKPLVVRMRWCHPAFYLLLLFPGILIGGIIVLCIQKQGTVAVGLCRYHRSRRLGAILVGAFGALLGFATIIAGPIVNQPILVLVGLVVLLGSLVYAVVYGRTIVPVLIQNGWLRLKGACPEFLAQFSTAG